MGTPYRYSAWQPVAVNATPAHPMALYYGNLFTSTALASGNRQVELLVNETFFTAYAIYKIDDDDANADAQLSEIALVNLAMYNSTQPPAERPYTEITLPRNMIGSNATLKRLTALGADVTEAIQWAGQSVSMDGSIVGIQVLEPVTDPKILIAASEAVLIAV